MSCSKSHHENESHEMTSQMSHTKSITQINHTIESHKMGHKWDDVTHKIQKITAPGN